MQQLEKSKEKQLLTGINNSITNLANLGLQGVNTNGVSDGAHTFGELYYDRMVLFNVLTNCHKSESWKSKLHDDGTMFDGYFIVGITTPEGPFTYHYENKYWEAYDVQELKTAPPHDGHTSKDIHRLFSL